MKPRHWCSGATLAVLLALALAAPTSRAGEEPNAAIEAKIRSMAPNAAMIAVSETPIDGVLQVQVNSEIFYATADARYLITGRVIDMDTRIDLTDQAKAGIRRGLLADLDPAQQISFSPALPEHELLVFTDIDCGYCRKLHSQINDYLAEGIAIHYLAFPRAGIGSHSYEKYVSVWCADDQRSALTEAKAGTEPEPLQCDNPVADQYQLARDIGVTGTPALLTANGTLIPGYMPPEQLKDRLESIKAQAKQAP